MSSSSSQSLKPILVTGAAGFIGFHVAKRLLHEGAAVVGLDNLNAYYDVRLKEARLAELRQLPGFTFHRADLENKEAIVKIFETGFQKVIHLAAQAGVRYSLVNPHAYVDSNITGFLNILESSYKTGVSHLVYASSSSVYGLSTNMPFSVKNPVDHPVSLYAATKKANELMAHVYAHLHALPCTGLRFFTVYGPWGRPDMALFLFTKAILEGKPIDLYNHGNMRRDFTYIDDIVEGVVRISRKMPQGDAGFSPDRPQLGVSAAPYRVYNIGNNQPVELSRMVEALEEALGKKAEKRLLPIQPGDVPATYADVDDLFQDVGFKPSTPIETGIAKFVEWYRYYAALEGR